MRQLIAIFGIFLATSAFPAVPLPLSVQWYAQAGLLQHQSIEQAMLAKRHPMQMYAAPTTKLGSAQKAWPKDREHNGHKANNQHHHEQPVHDVQGTGACINKPPKCCHQQRHHRRLRQRLRQQHITDIHHNSA